MSRCWKVGDNVATDVILPFQYMVLTEPAELGLHVLENVRPGFAAALGEGDILLAGSNLGCGSSREQAPLSLKGARVGAVIAKSFARLFFRNCINIGLPAIACPEIADASEEGDDLQLDIPGGRVINKTRGVTGSFPAFPPYVLEILSHGGLIPALNRKRAEQ